MKEKIVKIKKSLENTKLRKVLMYIAFFIILFYPFNISFKDYIFPNQISVLVFYLIALVIMIIINFNNIKKSFKLYLKPTIVMLLLCFIFIICRNGDIINGHFGMPFFTIFLFILAVILSPAKEWKKISLNVMMIFILEHVFFSWFCYWNKDFYFSNILPLFPDFNKELIYQYEHNQIAGITQHYSTNATYLFIGIIVQIYYLKFNDKSKKILSLINILILLSTIGALLITGKRAQLIFGIIAIFTILCIKNRSKIKIKSISITSSFIIAIAILSIIFIPSILNPFIRTIDGFKNKDLMITRQPLYSLALEMFDKSKLIGNGWGTYKYFYHDMIQIKEREYMDTHNVYLQVLSEIGIIGFIVVIILFILMVYRGIKILLKENNAYIAIFLTYHIYLMFEGIIGNAFFDIPVLIPYSIFIAMYLSNFNIIALEEIKIKEKSDKKMYNKILSVSVAAYNLEKLIKQNLDSWLNEEIMDKLEVIVTDDGSKDNTASIVEEYAEKYPNTIKIIKQKNSGPGSTVNSGIKNANRKIFQNG